jgi:hypothetical protein
VTFQVRIQKLEASLEASKKFLLWLEHAKRAGGWACYWTEQLEKPLLPFEWFADEDAYFLWRLVHDANLAILTNAQVNADLRNLVHCALYGLLGQIARIDDSGVFVPVRPFAELATCLGEYLYAKLQAIFQETFCLAAAVDELSEIYLGDDQDILFADSRAILDTELSNLRGTAVTFAPMAEWFNVQPIAMEAYMSGHLMVDAKVAKLAGVSRVNALMRCGDQQRFFDALHRTFPGLAANAGQRSHSSRAVAPHT